MPNKKRVVSVRDVIFNEDEVWHGVPLQRVADEIKELDEAIQVIELPQADELEDIQLSEDLEVESEITRQTDHEAEDLDADNIAAETDTDKLAEDEDQKWAQNQYPTPDPSDLEVFLANSTRMWVDNLRRQHAYDTIADRDKADLCKSEGMKPARLDQLDKQQKQRFYDFAQHRVSTNLQNVFTAGSRMGHRRDLPPESVNYRELKGHPFEEQSHTDMEIHIQQQRQQFILRESVSSANAKVHQLLGCQWVFKYKTNKHGWLQKCEARLVLCGSQQKRHDLPTRATTLAITSLRVLLALVAKFDLETLQLDEVNAFVYSDLDETVFMRMPPRYGEQGKVLKLNRALYGLRWSPLLWQQKLTDEMKKLGFEEIPQEPCVVQKNGIICFFYVDDIVFAFKKDQRDEVERTVASLSKALTIERKGELKWFLGLHMIRDRSERALWLSQKAYIMKICNDLAPITSTSRLPSTPMEILELLAVPDNEDITDASQTLYQRKVGSLLFAAIATRPDIAFAVSRLSRFNQRPGKQHHKAADRVFHYLFQTQDYCIRYWGDSQDLSSFVYASDASFGDNTLDRKSF